MIELSIVVPTCNRAPLLRQCIETITRGTRCEHEIIVVDGASTDGTQEIVRALQPMLGDRMTYIREQKRAGFVRAANRGFAAARGFAMCWINDDARPLPGALDRGVDQLRSAPNDVGFIAMFHKWHSSKNIAYQCSSAGETYSLCHVRGTLYCNFPMGRREVWDRLQYLDERFTFCGADPDLSLAAWHAGYRVEPAWGVCIDHDEHEDDRRTQDQSRMHEDNRRLFDKWCLPPRNPLWNEFDPERPCTLRGIASLERLVA